MATFTEDLRTLVQEFFLVLIIHYIYIALFFYIEYYLVAIYYLRKLYMLHIFICIHIDIHSFLYSYVIIYIYIYIHIFVYIYKQVHNDETVSRKQFIVHLVGELINIAMDKLHLDFSVFVCEKGADVIAQCENDYLINR